MHYRAEQGQFTVNCYMLCASTTQLYGIGRINKPNQIKEYNKTPWTNFSLGVIKCKWKLMVLHSPTPRLTHPVAIEQRQANLSSLWCFPGTAMVSRSRPPAHHFPVTCYLLPKCFSEKTSLSRLVFTTSSDFFFCCLGKKLIYPAFLFHMYFFQQVRRLRNDLGNNPETTPG